MEHTWNEKVTPNKGGGMKFINSVRKARAEEREYDYDAFITRSAVGSIHLPHMGQTIALRQLSTLINASGNPVGVRFTPESPLYVIAKSITKETSELPGDNRLTLSQAVLAFEEGIGLGCDRAAICTESPYEIILFFQLAEEVQRRNAQPILIVVLESNEKSIKTMKQHSRQVVQDFKRGTIAPTNGLKKLDPFENLDVRKQTLTPIIQELEVKYVDYGFTLASELSNYHLVC